MSVACASSFLIDSGKLDHTSGSIFEGQDKEVGDGSGSGLKDDVPDREEVVFEVTVDGSFLLCWNALAFSSLASLRASEKLDIPTRVRIRQRNSEKIVVYAEILDTFVINNISR